MKDMFYKYDNDCKENGQHGPHFPQEETKVLESCSNSYIITDIKGNELGVEVKHNNAFTLYFSINGCGYCVDEIFNGGKFLFEILSSTKHDVLISHEYTPGEVMNPDTGDIEIHIDTLESRQLDIDSYRMRLTIL